MPDFDLRIGIENELFLEGPSNVPDPWAEEKEVETYANDVLVPFYNKKRGRDRLRSNFSVGSHPGHEKDHTDYNKWTVTTDTTLGELDLNKNDQDVEGCPFEFVSPILSFYSDGLWRDELKTHWATLLAFGKVNIDNTCATHVHISRNAAEWGFKPEDWTEEQLRKVAQAVLYFDEAFDAILAPSRRKHPKTNSNKAKNKKLKDRNFGECCELIQRADIDHLVSLMQPSDSVQSDDISHSRFYRWNFENTKQGNLNGNRRIGTIEFRCAPGVLTADHCSIWVVLAVYFVQAAAQYGTKDILKEGNGSSPKNLKDFILKAEPKSKQDRDLLDIPFKHLHLDTDKKMKDAFDESLRQLGL